MSTPRDPGQTLPPGSWLEPQDGHRVWWAEGGDPRGVPVLIVHGGPGGASRPQPSRWFDALAVRWFVFDQRGCGRSEPAGGTHANTVPALLADMERLRERHGLPAWALAAGSWGARLALAYAAEWPDRVNGLMLRSPFLGSLDETRRYIAPWWDWLGPQGRQWLGEKASNAVVALYQEPTGSLSSDTALSLNRLSNDAVVRAWSAFDEAQSQPGGVAATGARCAPASLPAWSEGAAASWRVHLHHALHGWGEADGVARGASRAGHFAVGPVRLVWGAADATCDPACARELAARLPGAQSLEVALAGHRMTDERLAPALASEAARWVDDLVATRTDRSAGT